MKYILLLTLYGTDGIPNLEARETNLTGQECIAALEAYVETSPGLPHGQPSCELDSHANPIGTDHVLPA